MSSLKKSLRGLLLLKVKHIELTGISICSLLGFRMEGRARVDDMCTRGLKGGRLFRRDLGLSCCLAVFSKHAFDILSITLHEFEIFKQARLKFGVSVLSLRVALNALGLTKGELTASKGGLNGEWRGLSSFGQKKSEGKEPVFLRIINVSSNDKYPTGPLRHRL